MIKTKISDKTKAAPEAPSNVSRRYIEGIGRRKNAIARVRITPVSGGRGARSFLVNGRGLAEYFSTEEMRLLAAESASKAKLKDVFDVSVRVEGGGIHAQAEAVRHGFARALVLHNEDLRKRLKRAGLLKRDPRMKERRKFGLKKARKAPQWSKR